MGQVVAGFASSHAFALREPERWDATRQMSRGFYKQRYGAEPPERPEIAAETDEENAARYSRLWSVLEGIRSRLHELKPDALILLGDDQDENFLEDNLPQLAIFKGEEITPGRRGMDQVAERPYRCDAVLAEGILRHMVEDGFDLASSNRLPDDRLKSHAHTQILSFLDLDPDVALVPIFVNAHLPAPTPRRCYEFGQGLRRAVEAQTDGKRVALYASGGLSHFPPDFPFRQYSGPGCYGWIDVEFDRALVEHMTAGRGSELAKLTSADLLRSGNMETRQWIALVGAMGDIPPAQLVYEPFFRGIMGMAAGIWEPTGVPVGSR
jgi:hypothetical protein